MAFLITLTYFVIGFVGGLFVYDYYCKDFNKRNKKYPLKLTWEEYAHQEGPGACMGFTIVLWPILLIIIVCYYIFQYPIDCIKNIME